MNGAGWGLLAVILLTLVLVAFGAQSMQDQQAAELQALTEQRAELIHLADQARLQRDIANARGDWFDQERATLIRERDEALLERDEALSERDAALRLAELRAGEIARLQTEIAGLVDQRDDLQAHVELLKTVNEEYQQAQQMPIPVTSPAVDAGVDLGSLARQAAPWLTGLVGVMAVGGSGYAAYRLNDHRRVTVRMTREQLDEYIRWQRGR